MDDNVQFRRVAAGALGVTGVGAVLAAVGIGGVNGIYVALIIVLLAVLLFGGYFLWNWWRARSKRGKFESELGAQTAATPRAISDPNLRASLDTVRQKFQKGLNEFKSRGKDIYQLPWYAIIGESGSGKSEAIRHSGIDFPPGLQDEFQGTGGTVNMDWWFTNRAIILDTAGSMIFNEAKAGEAPEWREFLRLLKRARYHRPINGLLLVLSVESFIRDSADDIREKAGRLAQQVDLIQRTLDVRFPVYLLVTKCDLLIGFREFFDSIDDPLLQHQMFGWSNPDPLDSPFRPELIEQHLNQVAERLRRRRLALLRSGYGSTGRLGETTHFLASSYSLGKGPAPARRLDEVDSLFALPDSVMRLAPRLGRYLETIFTAGVWSAKPVFLRGMYFTSSMREGKALDETIAFATGIPLDQLPEDRTWEKNKAYFLRDLFMEKVFREHGLVTRATNTLKLLRQRQVAIFGSATAALLLVILFAWFARARLNASVAREAAMWETAAKAEGWKSGTWVAGSVITGDREPFKVSDASVVLAGGKRKTVGQFQQDLMELTSRPLSGGWFFAPVSWFGKSINANRYQAQQLLLESALLKPLIFNTRTNLQRRNPAAAPEIKRHADAWLALVELEADKADPRVSSSFIYNGGQYAPGYLQSFLAYLTQTNGAKLEPGFIQAFRGTFASAKSRAQWPPDDLLVKGGDSLAANPAIALGLDKYNSGSAQLQTKLGGQLKLLNNAVNELADFGTNEMKFFSETRDPCVSLAFGKMKDDQAKAEADLASLDAEISHPGERLPTLAARYELLAAGATNSSVSALQREVRLIYDKIDYDKKSSALVSELLKRVEDLVNNAGSVVRNELSSRRLVVERLDANDFAPVSTNGLPAYQARLELYTNACGLSSISSEVTLDDIGDSWKKFSSLSGRIDGFRAELKAYGGPLKLETTGICNLIASNAVERIKQEFVGNYVTRARKQLELLRDRSTWTWGDVTNVYSWFVRIDRDLKAAGQLGEHQATVARLGDNLNDSREAVLRGINNSIANSIAFPVLRDSNAATSMQVQDLVRLRALLNGLPGVLKDDVWQSPGGSQAQLKTLQDNLARYSAVINSLVKSNGTAARWELYLVPPADPIVGLFREARVSGAKNPNWNEISGFMQFSASRKIDPIAEGTLDSEFKLSFRRGDPLRVAPDEKSPLVFERWGIVHCLAQATPAPDGDPHKWRFQVKLEGRRGEKGTVTFEIKLLDAPFPMDQWPQSAGN